MIALPSYPDSTTTMVTVRVNADYLVQVREEKARLRRIRNDRMKALKREIQVAKRKLREHDHLLAELRSLERDLLKEMEEDARR